MKPYYDKDGITIYHGDCREVLPHVEAEVFITDPPYGVAFQGKRTKHTKRWNAGYTTEDNGEIGPEAVRSMLQKCKRGVVFSGKQGMFKYPLPVDIGCVFCPSGAGRGSWGFTLFHPVLFYGKAAAGNHYPASIRSFDTVDDCGHPCPKPLRWMLWVIGLACKDKDTILDPFAGSGTTLRRRKGYWTPSHRD